MGKITKTKRIYINDIMAEIDVAMTEEPKAWGPHIEPSELDRIDAVRDAIKAGNLKDTAKEARLYSVKPLAM